MVRGDATVAGAGRLGGPRGAQPGEEGREECENLLVWERFFDSRDDGVDAVCLFHSGRVEGTGDDRAHGV